MKRGSSQMTSSPNVFLVLLGPITRLRVVYAYHAQTLPTHLLMALSAIAGATGIATGGVVC